MKCAGTASREGRVRIQNDFRRLEIRSGQQGLVSSAGSSGCRGRGAAGDERGRDWVHLVKLRLCSGGSGAPQTMC